ncbi:MAG: c-type cytochrome, partial [Gammaproteobacteria bacterium]
MRVPDTRMVMAAVAVAGWLVSTTAAGEGNAENGRRLAYTCMGCHGIENQKNAYPKYSVPRLGGQNAAYIVVALTEYNAG